jgi:hypothetical protein
MSSSKAGVRLMCGSEKNMQQNEPWIGRIGFLRRAVGMGAMNGAFRKEETRAKLLQTLDNRRSRISQEAM